MKFLHFQKSAEAEAMDGNFSGTHKLLHLMRVFEDHTRNLIFQVNGESRVISKDSERGDESRTKSSTT